MKFEGNLNTFFPPDLVLFLANMGKEGVLSVSHGDTFLSVFFKNRAVVDAQSALADDKLGKMLFLRKCIDGKNYKRIMALRKETGIGLMQILEKLNLFPLERIEDLAHDAIMEVLFQLFLLKDGTFKFTSVYVDAQRRKKGYNPQSFGLELSRWVDEWRDIERTLTTLNRRITRSEKPLAGERGRESGIVLGLIRDDMTVGQLVAASPLGSFQSLKLIEQAVADKQVILHPPDKSEMVREGLVLQQDLFLSYRQAFTKIIRAGHGKDKINGLIGFCKDHFDQTFLLSMNDKELIRGLVFYKNRQGTLKTGELHRTTFDPEDYPVFFRVYSSGMPFFGQLFPMDLIKDQFPVPEKGECAVIHLGTAHRKTTMLYVISGEKEIGISPFQYLELLSWLIHPEKKKQALPADGDQEKTQTPAGAQRPPRAHDLGKMTRDLPPMPHLASRMLEILSDPDSSVDDLAKILSQDQAMMATLIKVSNSALYRTGHEIRTLNDAVTKLGFKTIRSLVLTATTHSIFPKNNAALQVMTHSLWQHSKECGIASRIIATLSGYPDPEEAFVAGLLHDIGKLAIILSYPEDYRDILRKQTKEGRTSLQAEQEVLGFDHRDIGMLLMDKWKMPVHFKDAVQGHHDKEHKGDLPLIVTLGNALSHLYGSQLDENLERHPESLQPVYEALTFSDSDIRDLIQFVSDGFKQSDVFD